MPACLAAALQQAGLRPAAAAAARRGRDALLQCCPH
eukprot:gene30-8039_t